MGFRLVCKKTPGAIDTEAIKFERELFIYQKIPKQEVEMKEEKVNMEEAVKVIETKNIEVNISMSTITDQKDDKRTGQTLFDESLNRIKQDKEELNIY